MTTSEETRRAQLLEEVGRLESELRRARRELARLSDEPAGGAAPPEGLIEALEEPFFGALFHSTGVGHGLFDPAGRFMAANDRFCEMIGWDREQLVGKTTADLTHPEDLVETRAQMALVSAGEAPGFAQRKRVRCGSDAYFWADLQVQGLRDARGQVVGLVGSLVDVDDLVRSRDQLKESEALFRAVVEQSRDAIGLAGPDGSYRMVNPAFCALVGCTEQELLALTVADLVDPERGPLLFPRVRDGQNDAMEGEVVRKDGTRIQVEVSGSPVRLGGEKLVLGVLRDVSVERRRQQERLELEARIQQAQKLESLEVLAGGIAHDFNNLLVGVLGNADLALMDMPLESPARESVRAIAASAERAADLVRQMLAYAGKGTFRVERISLSALIEEMEHLLALTVSRSVVLRYDLADPIPRVQADATQVRQAVLNLVVNASEAIGDRSGVVAVTTGAMECDRAYLRETYLDDDLPGGLYGYVEVSDTGAGMDEELRARLFDPFYTTKFAGRGLGLAAVLGIVRSHRGAIKVYSEPGRGTTMKLLLPVPSGENGAGDPDLPLPLSLQGRRRGWVLLADDEETVLAVSARMLERFGFQVKAVPDGREALEAFREDPERYTLVILDLAMPHLDGEACFREMRRIKADVRVILSSGYNHKELEARFAGKGLAGFIQKPYSVSALADRIAEVLAQPGPPSAPDSEE